MLLKKAFLPDVWLSSFVVWFTVFRSFSEIPIPLRLAPSGSSTACLHTVLFWNFQGCITVHLSRFRFVFIALLFSSTTLIEYHMSLSLSTTFYNFFNFFTFFFVRPACLPDNEIEYNTRVPSCQQEISFFCVFFIFLFYLFPFCQNNCCADVLSPFFTSTLSAEIFSAISPLTSMAKTVSALSPAGNVPI